MVLEGLEPVFSRGLVFFLIGSAAVGGRPASLGSSLLKEAVFFTVPGLEPGNKTDVTVRRAELGLNY